MEGGGDWGGLVPPDLPGELRGSRGLRGCHGRTKNPPNTKSAEFILTLGGNEFRGLCGFQGKMFSQVSGKIC